METSRRPRTRTRGRSRIGPLSLACTVGGMVLVEAGLWLGLLTGPVWKVIAAGFEAGTIGGLADWFAVTALFHEVRLPIIRRHTNIIIRNRERLTEGAVDLVANKWLSAVTIRRRLEGLSVSGFVLDWLAEPGNRARAMGAIRDVLGRVTSGLDSPAAAALLERLIKEQVRELDLAGPLGRWLEQAFRRGDHERLWTTLLTAARSAANDAQTQRQIRRLVQRAIDDYGERSVLRTLGVALGEASGLISAADITAIIVRRLNDFLAASAADPQHPLRARLDETVLAFARRLAAGDPEAAATVHGIRDRLVENPELRDAAAALLVRFKGALLEQLSSPGTPLLHLIEDHLARTMQEIRKNPELRERLDRWFRENLIALAERHHHAIAEMVRGSLHPDQLDDRALVDQIEEKVGADLQYIRLNGAVVGGAAGIILALLKLLFQI